MPEDHTPAQQRYEAALAAEERGAAGEAISALAAAIRLDPTRADWHHRLGKLQTGRRRWREAMVAFAAARRLQPGRAMRHY